ncbi:MAG: orotidine-5'-phosphate decarboxylase [Chthoniobacterales bacterium]
MNTKAKIIVALDFDSTTEAESLLTSLEGMPILCKVGLQLYTREGAAFIKKLQQRNLGVFLDLKLHDIPNTVRHAIKVIRDLEVDMTTVHTSGGPEMLEAAAAEAKGSNLLILGVTVLTSSNDATLHATGVPDTAASQVLRLAALAANAGIGGVVASPQEITKIREHHASHLKIVTPGVRPTWAEANDQKRIMTPREAVKAGADWLVIGRPITAAADPREALQKILAEIS